MQQQYYGYHDISEMMFFRKTAVGRKFIAKKQQ